MNETTEARRPLPLRPLPDIVAEIRERASKDAAESYAYHLAEGERQVKEIERNRQAITLLHAAGIEMGLNEWSSGHYVRIQLGFFPQTRKGNATLAERVRRIREVLGCRLEVCGKDVGDAKRAHVEYTLRAKDFPGIRVYFERKIPPGAKCRIVRHRSSYTSLVCEGI